MSSFSKPGIKLFYMNSHLKQPIMKQRVARKILRTNISFKQTNFKYHVSTIDHKRAPLILMQDFKCIQIPQELHFNI